MKNFKTLLIASMLVGGVGLFTLTSCGGTSTVTSEAPAVSRIQITQPQEDVLVGDTLNLDDYVTITGGLGPKSYTATLQSTSEDKASLDGHTLTILSEGEVKVRIEAGEKSGTFTVDALSQLKAKFKDFTSSITSTYFIDMLDVDNAGNIYLAGSGWLHNENYFAIDNSAFSATETGIQGILRAGTGNSYSYTMDDMTGKNFSVTPGIQANFDLYYLAMDMPLTASTFETQYDSQGNEIGLVTTDATTIANACLYMFSANSPLEAGATKQALSIEFVTFVGQDGEKIDIPLLFVTCDIVIDGKAYTDAMWIYGAIFGPEYGTVSVIDDYIASGEEPEPYTCEEVPTMFKTISSAKNYTEKVEVKWRNGTSPTDEGITAPADFDWGVDEFSVTSKVNDTTYYSEFDDGLVMGRTTKDSKLYSFTNLVNESVTDTITATAVTDTEGNPVNKTIWDEGYNDLVTTQFEDSSLYNDLVISAKSTNGTKTTFEWSQEQSTGNNITLAMFASTPGYGQSLSEFFQQAFQLQTGEQVLAYTVLYTNVIVDTSSLVFDLYVLWTSEQVLHFTYTFTDIGTTEVPALDNVQFPA